MDENAKPLNLYFVGVPYKNRTCNWSLGGTRYIHLTKGTC